MLTTANINEATKSTEELNRSYFNSITPITEQNFILNDFRALRDPKPDRDPKYSALFDCLMSNIARQLTIHCKDSFGLLGTLLVAFLLSVLYCSGTVFFPQESWRHLGKDCRVQSLSKNMAFLLNFSVCRKGRFF